MELDPSETIARLARTEQGRATIRMLQREVCASLDALARDLAASMRPSTPSGTGLAESVAAQGLARQQEALARHSEATAIVGAVLQELKRDPDLGRPTRPDRLSVPRKAAIWALLEWTE